MVLKPEVMEEWAGYPEELNINEIPLTPSFYYSPWSLCATISAPSPYNVKERWPATTPFELMIAIHSFLLRYWPTPLPVPPSVTRFFSCCAADSAGWAD